MPAAWVAAAGALIGGISSATNDRKGSTSSSSLPYNYDYLINAANQAGNIYSQNPVLQYYPGQTVANQSPYTQAALGMTAGATLDPNSLTNQSLGQWQKTVNGDYLDPSTNPSLKAAVDDALGQVKGNVSGLYGSRGGNNYGSSAHEEWLGRTLANTALPIYAQNYQQERARQLNAAQLGPGMQQQGTAPLAQAGQATDAYQQALIDADKARFDFNQTSPWDTLQRYQSAISGNYGSLQSTPYFQANPYLNALGGAATGLGLYNQYQKANGMKTNSAGSTGSGLAGSDTGWGYGDPNNGGGWNGFGD